MASKSSKSKEKKQQRKELLARLGVAQQLITKANLPTTDHLESLAAFQTYTRNNLNLTIECRHHNNVNKDLFETLYQILETNMKKEYEACYWGWNDRDKRKEMSDKNPWFLIALDEAGHVVAYSHFKFDFDEELEVLYCYEVQVIEESRGKGIGKFLMQTMELIGAHSQMKKVMVTVFKHNPRAVHFFTSILKYRDDETSPKFMDPIDEKDYCYEILSKVLPNKKVPLTGS